MDRNKEVTSQRKTKEKKNSNRNSLNESADSSKNNENELLSYLKTYVVKDGTAELKEKLFETVETRRNLLRKNVIQIKTMFPFYFFDASLVNMDIFQLKNAK